MLMDLVPEDKKCGLKTPIWDEYKQIVTEAEEKEVKGNFLASDNLCTCTTCRSIWSCLSDLLSMRELSRHLL